MSTTPSKLSDLHAVTFSLYDDPDVTRLTRLKARRKLWLDVHLYLGLIAGAILSIIGITGSVLVFWQEIDEILNANLMTVTAQPGGKQAYRSWSEIETAVHSVLPAGAKLGWVSPARTPESTMHISYAIPSKTDSQGEDIYEIFVNPYTAQVIGQRMFYPANGIPLQALMPFFFKLHYALLLGDTGVFIVGILGVFFMVSVLTGIIVWWPLTGKWLQAITIKRKTSAERFNFDLHKTFGFYSAIVLLAVLISGVSMNIPSEFDWVVELFSPLTKTADIHSKPTAQATPITLSAVLNKIETHTPEGEFAWITPPSDRLATFQVCKKNIASLNRFVGWRCFTVDQYSAEIISVIDQHSGTGGDVFKQWQWPLHSGQAFGMTGRILVLLSGLACPVLFVTGIIRWLQKSRSAQQKNNRRLIRSQD